MAERRGDRHGRGRGRRPAARASCCEPPSRSSPSGDFPKPGSPTWPSGSGTSPALVIYYFKTKDNLLTEAMRFAEDSWYDLGARRMAVIDSAAERLEEIVAMTCLPEADDRAPRVVDPVARPVGPVGAPSRGRLGCARSSTPAGARPSPVVVRDGQESGEFEDIDAADFSITFSALLDGFAIQIALDDPVVDPGPRLPGQHALRLPGARVRLEAEQARRAPEGASKATVDQDGQDGQDGQEEVVTVRGPADGRSGAVPGRT